MDGVLEGEDLELWRAFLGWSQGIHAAVNRAVTEAADLSVPEFEVLTRLWSETGGVLSQQDLTKGLGWSPSRLSHQLDRLERRSFVDRSGTGRGRAMTIRLTKAGRAHLLQAFDVHGHAFRVSLLDHLSETERKTLLTIMTSYLNR